MQIPQAQALSPLHQAAGAGHARLACILLDCGCEWVERLVSDAGCELTYVNTPSAVTHTTALHKAVEAGSLDTVEVLLRHQADVSAKNVFDQTPLDIARARHSTPASATKQPARDTVQRGMAGAIVEALENALQQDRENPRIRGDAHKRLHPLASTKPSCDTFAKRAHKNVLASDLAKLAF